MKHTGGSGLFIGLMSGTSCDAIDAALIRIADGHPTLLTTHTCAYPAALRQQLLALPETPEISLPQYGALDNAVADAFSAAVVELLAIAGTGTEEIVAIGSHGQNIWHQPKDGISMQIGNPSLIACRTGITTVADFRRKDLALGGQGAPLTPVFHNALFASPTETRYVLNIGGICNLTTLDGKHISGHDTGPGNALMDLWCERHLGQAYDRDGTWAASGTVSHALLANMLADPYFALPAPKSTGREHFNSAWLQQQMAGLAAIPPQDVQRTLLELTARTATLNLSKSSTSCQLIVCGGGTRNPELMRRLEALSPCPLNSSAAHGFSPDWIEAAAFAWFASRTVAGLNSSAASVTGASRDAVLGGVYAP